MEPVVFNTLNRLEIPSCSYKQNRLAHTGELVIGFKVQAPKVFHNVSDDNSIQFHLRHITSDNP